MYQIPWSWLFAGQRAPLSLAVAKQGHIEVQPPYDWYFGQDIFTEEGREELSRLMEDPDLVAEHWAPECKMFSRARGKPIKLRSGRVINGPQPVRDAKHLMGYPWLPPEVKARVRRSNTMVLKALRRAKAKRPDERRCFCTIEHPYRSWLWEFTLVKEMEEDPSFSHSVGSCCCFGGQREKCHTGLLGYEVEELEDGSLHYPTSEEAEYPWDLCRAYARALRLQVDRDEVFERMVISERERHFAEELTRSTTRLSQELVTGAIAGVLARTELGMVPGREKSHLRRVLRTGGQMCAS
eukprot:s2703_g10.t1